MMSRSSFYEDGSKLLTPGLADEWTTSRDATPQAAARSQRDRSLGRLNMQGRKI
jgi:hypothetical protein